MTFGKGKKDKDGKKLANCKLGRCLKELGSGIPHVNFVQEERPKRRFEPEIIGSERPAFMISPEEPVKRARRGKRRGYDMGGNPSDLIRMRKRDIDSDDSD